MSLCVTTHISLVKQSKTEGVATFAQFFYLKSIIMMMALINTANHGQSQYSIDFFIYIPMYHAQSWRCITKLCTVQRPVAQAVVM